MSGGSRELGRPKPRHRTTTRSQRTINTAIEQ